MVRMSDAARQLHARMSTVGITMQGVSGFFSPRLLSPFRAGFPVASEQASFYETSALAATLERFVDFDHLNQANATRDTCRSYPCQRRLAADISANSHQWPALLGRRALLEHAARKHPE